MHSVFERALLTSEGKSIVILNETEHDTQVFNKNLHKYNTKSVKAFLIVLSQLSFLAIARID